VIEEAIAGSRWTRTATAVIRLLLAARDPDTGRPLARRWSTTSRCSSSPIDTTSTTLTYALWALGRT
jgi:hypothetical protein